MKVNFIDFVELCDRSFSAMLNNEHTYVNTETGIYVPPPTAESRKIFDMCIMSFAKEKFVPDCKNFLVLSCKPSDNWRLKHVGKRYANMIESKRFVPVIKQDMPKIEIGSGWEDYFNGYFEKSAFKKFEVPEVDVADIISVLSISETIISKQYSENVCLKDGNTNIDHSSPIQKYVMSAVSRAFTTAGEVK